MNNIELITNEGGDWAVLKVDGKIYYEGHSIPDFIWLKIIHKLGIKISSKEISDENMEERLLITYNRKS